MSDRGGALVRRLFDCINRRDANGMAELCDEELEFFPAATAQAVGRNSSYTGPTGLHDYLADVAQAWEELTITPDEVRERGARLLVRGRVYARSRDLGIRDVPVAWIWELRGDRFVRGEAFPDPEQAEQRFSAASPRAASD